PFAESWGSSTQRLPGSKLSAAPNRVGAFVGTESPRMGSFGKSRHEPALQVGCVMLGLVGSSSGTMGDPAPPVPVGLNPPTPLDAAEGLSPPLPFPPAPLTPPPPAEQSMPAMMTAEPMQPRARYDLKFIDSP